MWCKVLVLLPWSDWRCGARCWCSYLGVTRDVVQDPGALTLGVTGDVVQGSGALTFEWQEMWCKVLVLLLWSDWR